MKRRFTILTAALALLAILAIPMGMMGQTTVDVTLSSGTFNDNVITWTCADGNITIQQLKGSGSTNPNSSYISAPRVYKQNILSFVGTNGYTITNIDIKCDGSYYGITKYAGTTISNNDVSNNTTALNSTWSTTNGGTHTIATVSSDGLSEIYIQNGHSSDNGSTQLRITKLTITYKVSGSVTATTVTINTSGLTNTDVYTSTTAGTLSASVTETVSGNAVSGATVTWTSSNTDVATIDNNGAVTLVAVGTTTITASYAGGNGYGTSSATYELSVTSSEPYVQPTTIEIVPNYAFWGKIGQFSGDTYSELEGSKDNVTLSWTRGSGSTYANSTAMRFYKDNNLTFTAPEGYEITSIVITFTSAQSDLSFSPGSYSLSGATGTWTGSSATVTMSRPSNASSYAQISLFTITLGLPSTDPSITAENVNIAYNATSGEIEYTITNPATNGNLSVSENVDWISNAAVNTSESKVTFTTTANEATTAREGVITLTYTYGNNETVTKDVTVTQAAAPMIYTTIPALFEAATSNATDVTITFGSWVISAVHNSNAYLTDNQGHGLIIYASDHGFQVNDVLTGTVNCKLQTYRGSAELTELTSSVEGLSVSHNGTVAEQNIAINTLGGVNTGALLAYQGLIYNGTALVDGNNNTITPYTTLYSYTFEEGKTYNVKGIYLQYNSTKEILPRSAADIEEVVVTEPSVTVTPATIDAPAEGADGTLTITYENIENFDSFDYYFCDADGNELEGDDPDWIYAEINEENDAYILSYIIDANDGAARTAYMKVYTFDDNLEEVYAIVTINQAAYVVDYAVLPFVWNGGASADFLALNGVTSHGLGSDYAAGNAPYLIKLDNTGDYIQVKTDSQPGKITIDVKMIGGASTSTITIQGSADGETFTNVETLTISGNQNDELTLETTNGFAATDRYVRMLFTKGSNVGVGPITIAKPVAPEYTLAIEGYGNSDGGYYLIASPVTVDPSTVGMTTGEYDLYSFNQAEDDEWRNYKAGAFTSLEPGKGYLYAHKTGGEFTLTGEAYNGDGTIELTYDDNAIDFKGWNLVGNPWGEKAYPNHAFYTMAEGGAGIDVTPNVAGTEVAAMTGIFVVAEAANETVTFSKTATGKSANLALNITNSSKLVDRAIVSFGEGRQLPKFQLNPNHTKVYFEQNGKDLAVVNADEMGEMPVSFKAENNGTYTINVNTENVEMDYLHLIDNMTGADIDLLANPSYSFDAKVTDYTSRFRLVFSANNGISEQNSETFAFFNGNDWTINNEGEATLQVVDMTGRVLSTETVNGNATTKVNAATGVYMLRLINGNNIKTQKVVVK